MTTNSKKVFIDCGANIGQSIDNFMAKWKDWKEYDMISYEANPRLASKFNRFSTLPNFKFNQEAIWTSDGTVDFYLCNTGHNWGSSIIGTKKSGQLSKAPTVVKCADIDRVVREYSLEDYIILKLDVEGAEYELLDYMLSKNTFELVNVLYLEFHTGKVHKTIEDNKRLLSNLAKYKNLQVFHDTNNQLNFL